MSDKNIGINNETWNDNRVFIKSTKPSPLLILIQSLFFRHNSQEIPKKKKGRKPNPNGKFPTLHAQTSMIPKLPLKSILKHSTPSKLLRMQMHINPPLYFTNNSKGKNTRLAPDSALRISGVNIIKHNIFRHHAIMKHCEEYAPHVVMLVEVGHNDRQIQDIPRSPHQ